MPIIPRSEHDLPQRGEWSPYMTDGQKTAVISCPECAHRASLEAYIISPVGLVKNLRCNDGCGWFYRDVQLQGWKLN
jgi:hypothetical protein